MTTLTLASALAGDGSTSVGRVKTVPGNNLRETVLIIGNGTWNGATLTLQVSADGSTYVGLQNESGTAIGAFTSDFAINLELPKGVRFKGVVSGSGSPTSSLNVKAVGDIEAG